MDKKSKMNGDNVGREDTTSNGSANVDGGDSGAAKSVININDKNITIVSTAKDGTRARKVTTTPLRNNHDPALSGAHVSSRIKDTQFVSALTQKYQANGAGAASTSPRPASLAASSSGFSRGSSSQSSTSSSSEDISSKLSSLLLQQQQQKHVSTTTAGASSGEERQGMAVSSEAGLMNGHGEGSPTASETNGDSGVSSPDLVPPPAPPPSAIVRSVSEQPAPYRKADACYTPRPKSYSSQTSTEGGNFNLPKNDLMAALTAVVTSGSPSASLRKTRGPGKGGVTEVFTSKKSPGSTTPTDSDKQAAPSPGIEQFEPQNFLNKVPETDKSGHPIPEWKRLMMAKSIAQKAQQEYLEQKKKDDYEARFKGMPDWKRNLIEKKGSGPNNSS